jgi:hypothetical protein
MGNFFSLLKNEFNEVLLLLLLLLLWDWGS